MTGDRSRFGSHAMVPALALLALAGYVFLHAWKVDPQFARDAGTLAVALCGAPLVWRTVAGLVRGRFAADVVASMAIVTAVVFEQPLPGLVVVLMQSGGEALEEYAGRRASRAVHDLERAAPSIAHRLERGGVVDVPIDAVAVGDRLLVRPGEMVPCDAEVVEGTSHLDTAQLTGEPLPRRVGPGAALLSGSFNQESPLTIRATAPPGQSQYARIVELVRSAQASKAPLQRLADRYAVWFTPLTLGVCAVAWALSGDPLRILAVLVVATPCPLILATPVAIIGGIDRAARHAVIFRSGAALESLADVDTAVFDKTGTLTVGRPRVAEVAVAPGFDENLVLSLAGAVEHGSSHLLARSLVEAAEARGIAIPPANLIVEEPGLGVWGQVEGRMVAVGARSFVRRQAPDAAAAFAPLEGGRPGVQAYVAVDGQAAGIVVYADQARPEALAVLTALQAKGIGRTLLLSGDSTVNARALAASLGITEVRGDLLAEDKVSAVRSLRAAGRKVLMVGDGTNDAAALSSADVGVALAGGGTGITTEASDVVLLGGTLDGLPGALEISRRSLRIARESIWVGLGCSAVAMVFAAGGHIPPTVGAVLQEVIDVAVIVNALRASRDGARPRATARARADDARPQVRPASRIDSPAGSDMSSRKNAASSARP